MINKISIAHVNYTEEINTTFPKLLICKSHDNNGILNLELTFNQSINDIYDDLSFDNEGKYISICIGQWHHKTTGKYISITKARRLLLIPTHNGRLAMVPAAQLIAPAIFTHSPAHTGYA